MSIQLDHTMVSARDKKASAELLASILDVPWSEIGAGPFCPVYVNEVLTPDFDQVDGPFPIQHFCFRVSESEFDRWKQGTDQVYLALAYLLRQHFP